MLVLPTESHQFFLCQYWEFGGKSRQLHVADDFLYFRHLFAWWGIGIAMKNHSWDFKG